MTKRLGSVKSVRAAVALLVVILCGLMCAVVAQETSAPTAPAVALTPAQQRAQARAAAVAQRKEQAQEKAEENAQARAQAKQAKQGAATPAAAPSTARTSPTAQPAASPAASAATATPNKAGGAATADKGTLTQGNVVFTSTGCVHNGSKAVCTFTFVNQGNAGNMSGPMTLAAAQFVDDAHVPHRSDSRYYLDKYGTRQARLYANAGDTGTFVAEYTNVDARVTTGEFHLRDQTIGGISVSAPAASSGQASGQAVPQPTSAAKTTSAPH